jgi:hypothetical protein
LLECVAGPIDSLPPPLKDAFYTAIGFGVLGLQQLQVQRRDLRKQLRRAAGQVEERVDPLLDDLEARLPDAPRVVVKQARVAARTVQRAILD